jgi:hypothetical protein
VPLGVCATDQPPLAATGWVPYPLTDPRKPSILRLCQGWRGPHATSAESARGHGARWRRGVIWLKSELVAGINRPGG